MAQVSWKQLLFGCIVWIVWMLGSKVVDLDGAPEPEVYVSASPTLILGQVTLAPL